MKFRIHKVNHISQLCFTVHVHFFSSADGQCLLYGSIYLNEWELQRKIPPPFFPSAFPTAAATCSPSMWWHHFSLAPSGPPVIVGMSINIASIDSISEVNMVSFSPLLLTVVIGLSFFFSQTFPLPPRTAALLPCWLHCWPSHLTWEIHDPSLASHPHTHRQLCLLWSWTR